MDDIDENLMEDINSDNSDFEEVDETDEDIEEDEDTDIIKTTISSINTEEIKKEEDFPEEKTFKTINCKFPENKEYLKRIEEHKLNFLKRVSKNEIIEHLSANIYMVKNGGRLIENTKTYNYFDTTEEGEVIESLLLNTNPTVSVKYGLQFKLDDYDYKEFLINFKNLLRPVYNNEAIITNNLKEKFPLFFKNIFVDDISTEELNELKKK